jgi:putative multiple sugar transport system substrate-binding protein
MKGNKLIALGAAAIMGLASLTACSDSSDSPSTSAAATTSDAATGGFAADSVIGVSLPWLGTQNWAEANDQFKTELEKAGFKAQVLQADNKVPNQQAQIESLIEAGAKVIVIGPVDGSQLGTVVEKAKAEGIYIIGYDRLIEKTDAVDAVVQYGSVQTGRLQGQALLDGLAEMKGGSGPYNIELFGGGPADPNAPNFFKGAMEILQPKIDDGTLVVVSGQTDFATVATADWDNATAQKRMETLLATHYGDKKIDGVLSPNDGIARAILTACKDAGQDQPAISGLDAEDESIKWIKAGDQYSTVAKPTPDLVAKTIELIQQLQAGGTLTGNNETADNGNIEVPVWALEPKIITKANVEQYFPS